MNKVTNFDSHLISNLSDSEASQVSGGFVYGTALSGEQAQKLLGNNYNSQEKYGFVVLDTDGSNNASFGDLYLIATSSGQYYRSNGGVTFNAEQARQLGNAGTGTDTFTLSFDLNINGTLGSESAASSIFVR